MSCVRASLRADWDPDWLAARSPEGVLACLKLDVPTLSFSILDARGLDQIPGDRRL